MAEKLGEIFVEIQARTAKLENDLKRLEGKVEADAKRMGEKAGQGFNKGFGERLRSLGKTLKSVAGFSAVASAVTGLFLAFRKGYNDLKTFQIGMRNVNTILNLSESHLNRMSKEVLTLGRTLGISGTNLTDALYQATSAGIDAAHAVKFLGVAARAAKAGLSTTEQAVDGLTTVLNAFHLSAKEAGRVADIMFQTVKLGKTTFGELSSSISIAASIAASAGISFEEVAAAIATLTKQGVPTSVAMTQIRQAIIGLNKHFGDGWAKTMTLQDAMKKLAIETNNSQTALMEILGRIEGVNAVLAMTGKNAQMATSDLKAMNNSFGAMSIAYLEQTKAMQDQLDKAGRTISQVFQSAIEKVTPVIVKFANGLKLIAETMGVLDKANAEYTTANLIAELEASGAAQEKINRAKKIYISELRREMSTIKSLKKEWSGFRTVVDVQQEIKSIQDEQLRIAKINLDYKAEMVGKTEKEKQTYIDFIKANEQLIQDHAEDIKKLERILEIHKLIKQLYSEISGEKKTEVTTEVKTVSAKQPNAAEPISSAIAKKRQEVEHFRNAERKKVEYAQMTLADLITLYDEQADYGIAAFNGLVAGFESAFAKIRIRARSEASLIEKIFVDLANAIIAELGRIAAQQAAIFIVKSVLGATTGAPAGHSGGSFIGTTAGVKKMAAGGTFTVPAGYDNDTFPMYVESGEVVSVTPKNKVFEVDRLVRSLNEQLKIINLNLIDRQPSEFYFHASLDGTLKGQDIKLSYDKTKAMLDRYV